MNHSVFGKIIYALLKNSDGKALPQKCFEHSEHFNIDFTHHADSERGIYELNHDGNK